MKKILLVAALLIVCGSVAAQAMGDLYVSGTWRYKMTVVVETPEGTKTGSAVREVSNSASSVKLIDLPQATNPAKVRGEAVVVDLGKRGVLFALLGGDYAYNIVYDAFPVPSGKVPSSADGIRYYSDLKNVKSIIEPGPLRNPPLAAFQNIKDAKTVQALTSKNIDSFFGEGVRIKEIAIEMTDEPITDLVDQYLPSFGAETGFMEWYKNLPYGDLRRVTKSSFK